MATEGAVAREHPLNEFVRHARPKMHRMVRASGVPEEDTEDLVQQTLVALVGCWDGVRNPHAWIVGATRKNCLMYWRSRRRRLYEAVDDSVLEWLAAPQRPAQELRDLEVDLETLAARLPTRYRSILRLRYGLGYDPPEIARCLGYRPSSIGKVTTRSLAALRGAFKDAGFRWGPPGARSPARRLRGDAPAQRPARRPRRA